MFEFSKKYDSSEIKFDENGKRLICMHASHWRWFDKQHGFLAYLYFPVSFIYTVVIVPFALSILGVIVLQTLRWFHFSIPLELILSSLFGIIIGVLLFNLLADRFSVRCFETCYRTCKHNRECASLRSQKCMIPHVQHNSKALLSLSRRKDET